MEKKAVITILTLAAYMLSQKGGQLFKLFQPYLELEAYTRLFINKSVWYVLFPFFILGLFHGFKKIGEASGLSKGFKKGMAVGFWGTLPMLLGAGLLANFNVTIDLGNILIGCLLAAVAEEILYRGLLFGQLFRHAGWGFLVAGLISAIVFGYGHLYQRTGAVELAGIFLVTFLGGMWFSWLYVEWGYNLWVPMAFHFFMNLSWSIFEVSDNALGGFWPNVFRALTIALSIYLTIRHKRETGSAWVVEGRRWWTGNDAATPQPSETKNHNFSKYTA